MLFQPYTRAMRSAEVDDGVPFAVSASAFTFGKTARSWASNVPAGESGFGAGVYGAGAFRHETTTISSCSFFVKCCLSKEIVPSSSPSSVAVVVTTVATGAALGASMTSSSGRAGLGVVVLASVAGFALAISM